MRTHIWRLSICLVCVMWILTESVECNWLFVLVGKPGVRLVYVNWIGYQAEEHKVQIILNSSRKLGVGYVYLEWLYT